MGGRGVKIVGVDTKYPNSNTSMFDFECVFGWVGGDWARNGVSSSELTTCIPLDFVVGKESNEVSRKGMRKFFKLTAERMRTVGMVSRDNKDEPILKN